MLLDRLLAQADYALRPRVRMGAIKACLILLILPGFLSISQARPVAAQEEVCSGVHQDVSLPLTDLGSNTYTRMDGQVTSFTGGLYPGGSNTRPPEHEAAGAAIAAQVTPLDADGNTDPVDGRIVMISVGMSNTAGEFSFYRRRIRNDPGINPRFIPVNGAQSGRTAEWWADPDSQTWQNANDFLAQAGLTPQQVQIAWIKETLPRIGDFPAQAQELQGYLEAIARNLKSYYPNIKLAYFSSRTRSYNYWRGLSPEPAAFETGFAVKWMIEKQILGDPALNYDPTKGEVKAPYLSWGPYLWIDGVNPRSDGRVWLPEDLDRDCTHPSRSGGEKVAEMLDEFLRNDSTSASWYRSGAAPLLTPTRAETLAPTHTVPVTATATLTHTPVPSSTSAPAATVVARLSPTSQVEVSLPPTVTSPEPRNISSVLGPSIEVPIALVVVFGLILVGAVIVIVGLLLRRR